MEAAMDVRTWAERMVETLSEQEMHDIVADGAEGFITQHQMPPGLEADDRQALIEEVERVCRERATELA
jgi:hypothetical protein